MRAVNIRPAIPVMLLLALSALGAVESRPQAKAPPEDAAFAQFWTRFKAAVAKDDREVIADMTRLPFMLSNKDLERADYIKKVPELFDRRARRCFATAKPLKDGDLYQVFCSRQIYLFEKVDGEYRFTEIAAND